MHVVCLINKSSIIAQSAHNICNTGQREHRDLWYTTLCQLYIIYEVQRDSVDNSKQHHRICNVTKRVQFDIDLLITEVNKTSFCIIFIDAFLENAVGPTRVA